MADVNDLLVHAAEQLLTAAGNSVGPVLGVTGAVGHTGLIQMFGATGAGASRTGPVGATGAGASRTGPVGATGAGASGAGSVGATGAGASRAGPVIAPLTIAPGSLGGRPGLLSRMGSKFTDIRRAIARAVSTPRAGAAALMPTGRKGVHLPFDKRFQGSILNPPTPQAGSIVGLFMLWQDKILIQKRVAAPATISCPSGFLNSSESFEEAAVRELAEESQFTPTPSPGELTLFHRTQQADSSGNLVDVAFYYGLVADPTTVVSTPGPQPASADEVDVAYDFSDISGAVVYNVNSGHAWIKPEDLERYVEGIAGENPVFAEAVEKFMDIQDEAFGRPVDNIDINADVPEWATNLFTPGDDAAIDAKCKAAKVIGPECLAIAVKRDIMAAEQYKNSLRLRKKSDAALKEYNEKAAELTVLKGIPTRTDEQETRMADLQRELESGYPDRVIHIRTADDGMVHAFKVPNPYRALAYRENRKKPVNFANPAGYEPSDKDPDGLMHAANLLLLNELAPPALIADSAMATSLLESLWYCGANPTLSNDPRCYPTKVLGELREWQANKWQTDAGKVAKDTLDADSSWGVTKQLMVALENGVAGSTVFPFIEVRTGVKAKPASAPALIVGAVGVTGATGPASTIGVTGGTGAPGPVIVTSVPKPLSLPPLTLGGAIVPLSLGGSGGAFAPIIPLTLGGHP